MLRKVVRLDMYSTLRLFAVFYALIGLYIASRGAIVADSSIVCPFGFEYPMLHATITVTLSLPHPASWLTMGVILIATVFYALTGLISGAAVVLIYNMVGKFWPLFLVQVEDEPHPAPVEAKDEAAIVPTPDETTEIQG